MSSDPIEMDGQLRTPAVYLTPKEPPITVRWEVAWILEPCGLFGLKTPASTEDEARHYSSCQIVTYTLYRLKSVFATFS